MDTKERAAVRRSLDELKPFLAAYLTQRGIRVLPPVGAGARLAGGTDIQALLKSCLGAWEPTLRRELPNVAKSYIHELIEIRNRWAHEEPFTQSEAELATDTARQLAHLIGAPTSNAVGRPSAAAPLTRPDGARESQRRVMARIFAECGRDPERAVRDYAAAERRGEVRRKSNKNDVSVEDPLAGALGRRLEEGLALNSRAFGPAIGCRGDRHLRPDSVLRSGR